MRRSSRIDFPGGLTHELVVPLMRALSTRPRHGFWHVADAVTFDLVAINGTVQWFVGVEEREVALVTGALRSALPSITLTPSGDAMPLPAAAWELRLSTTRRPLAFDHADEVAGAVLSAVSQTRRGEVVRLQWLVGPWISRRVVPPPSRHDESGLFDLNQLVRNGDEASALRDKQREPLLAVVARLGITADSPARVRALRQRVVGGLQLLRAPGVGLQRRRLPSWLVVSRLERLVQPAFGWPSVLNASELAAAICWPIGNPAVAGVRYSGRRQLPPAPASTVRKASSTTRVTGQATFPGREGLLALPPESALRHLHVMGPTGTGKSTLLANLALQDIAAGRAVVVVDPGAKGDLVRDILDRIPDERIDDIVLLDPSDSMPAGLNVLSGGDPALVVDAVVHVFHELWAAHWGPRTADVLHHGLLTLARTPGMTMCELPPLLLNQPFRQRVLQGLGDDRLGVGPFWAWYHALSDAERATVVGPVLNKLRAFTQREAIRAVIGQADSVNLDEVLKRRQVLLVNLSSGALGSETAQLLGALIMARLWQAITGRARLLERQRHPAFVYVDEFQQTLRLPLDLNDALVQARGLGVGLVLAHQHLGQLPLGIKTSLLANAGSRIVFGLRAADASVMAKELGGGLDAADLQGLAPFETYQSLHMSDGQALPASARTLPLGPSLGSSTAVVRSSRQCFGAERAEVDAALLRRRDGQTPGDAPVGTRRRGGRP